jgi:membrane-associated HD superfamily phosphohydrolase
MRKNYRKIILGILLCLSQGILFGCSDDSKAEAEHSVEAKLEDNLESSLDELQSNLDDMANKVESDLQSKVEEIDNKNFDDIFKKLDDGFQNDYYKYLSDGLKEKIKNKKDKDSFNAIYEDVFKGVFEEFYKNFYKNTKNIIYLDEGEYKKVYNNIKDKYYGDLKKLFVE